MLLKFLIEGQPGLPSGEEFVGKVFPNIWAFLVQLIAFIVMAVLVIKFAYKPVSEYLKKRKEFINQNLNSAQEKNDEASKNQLQAEQNLAESRKEALLIIENAQVEAEKEKQKILEETKKEIDKKKLQLEQDLLLQKEKVMQEAYDEVVDLALEASKTILSREVSSKDNEKLLDDFINDLQEKK